MKTKSISMMLVGMMMLGTGTSYGSTKNNQRQSPKTEHVVNTKSVKQNSHDTKICDCKTCKELVKKQQTKKQTKQCTCKFRTCSPEHQNNGKCVKNCQKQQKKSGPTCKIQPNVSHTNKN